MNASVYLPNEFIEHIKQILPATTTLSSFMSACQRPLKRSIRVNTLKITVAEFLEIAIEKGWKLDPIPWCKEGFWLDGHNETDTPLGNTIEHLTGLFYIQEASSMLPVPALFHDDSEVNSVLDMAAAPGSKTTQIAATMQHQGVIIANEYSASRVKVLHANLLRCGVHQAAITHFDGCVFGEWTPESFDAILLDAPCSGEGTIRKDPDAMKNWSIESIYEMAETQKALICSAFRALKPNGVMVYSTCTLSREENQQVCLHLEALYGESVRFESLVDLFSGADKAITEEGFLHVFPEFYDSEGFFIARIRKTTSTGALSVQEKRKNFPYLPLTQGETVDVHKALSDTFSIALPDTLSLWKREQAIWAFPLDVTPFLSQIRLDRIGIKLAEIHKNGYRWQHEVATALSNGQESRCVEITLADAREWFMGRDIRPEVVPSKGEVIVCYQHCPLGIGKWVGNKIKNNLPRELVKDKNLF